MITNLKKTFVVVIIFALLLANYFFYGTSIVYAIGDELVQDGADEKIEFSAFFKGQNGEEVNSISANIKDGATIFIKLKIADEGTIVNSSLSFSDANFSLLDFENDTVKEIDKEKNKIYLNDLIYGQEINLEIPIQFNKYDKIDVGDFEKEISVNLQGEYKTSDENKTDIEKSISLKLNWTDDASILINQSLEKFIKLDNNTIMQFLVNSNVEENRLPKESEKVLVNIPIFEENKIPEIVVLNNGVKVKEDLLKIDQESNTLEISYENSPNENNEINWVCNNDYTIIFEYEGKLEVKSQEELNLNTKVYTKLYTKEGIGNEDSLKTKLEEKGSLVSTSFSQIQDLYKGYMYAKTQNSTNYTENITFQVSELENLQNLKFYNKENNFLSSDENKFFTDSVIYRQTMISKDEFLRIFGQEGIIEILNSENELVAKITKDTQVNNQNEYVINYDKEYNNLKFVFTKPIEQGEFNLKNYKYIKGETSFEKEEIKSFEKLQSIFSLEVNQVAEDMQNNINLKDTVTTANLEINNNNLSSLEENKNVQVTCTLIANDNKHDLFKNPTFKLEFPEEVETINVNSIKKVFSDEMDIESANLHEENGKKVIEIFCKGEQTKFSENLTDQLQIIIDLDITLSKTIPSKKSQINMVYTNENKPGETYNSTLDINLVSKYGVLIYNKLSNIDTEEGIVESINDDINVGKLQFDENEKNVNGKIIVINNYETDLSEFTVIGKMPVQGEININGIELQTNIDTSLAKKVTVNNNAVIEYSSDNITWTEDVNNSKYFRVKMQDILLKPGEKIEIDYNFNVKKQESSITAYVKTDVSYKYQGNQNLNSSAIGLVSDGSAITTGNPDTENERRNSRWIANKSCSNIRRKCIK